MFSCTAKVYLAVKKLIKIYLKDNSPNKNPQIAQELQSTKIYIELRLHVNQTYATVYL